MATRSNPIEFDQQAMFAPSAAVELYMEQCLDQRPLPVNLRDAAKYSLLGPGKRLRPILVIRSCEALGGSPEAAMPAAAAIEMIHCFSLIHDDLPAMDDDDLRRGRPTLHKHTNEAMAILAGDLLNTTAFEIIATRLPSELVSRITHELATATNDMIAGQVYDTVPDFPVNIDPVQKLLTIHRHKTGALIRCACRMGAICGRATDPQVKEITRYGEAIGLMFQIVDDLLDVTQTTEQLGKTAQKDAQQGKLTYPGVMGIEKSRAEVTRLQSEAHDALSALDTAGAAHLRDLCDFMAVRRK